MPFGASATSAPFTSGRGPPERRPVDLCQRLLRNPSFEYSVRFSLCVSTTLQDHGGIEGNRTLICEMRTRRSPVELRPHETQRIGLPNRPPDEPVGDPINQASKPPEDPTDEVLHAREG